VIEIDCLDHLVLTVASIEALVRFYNEVLGMQVICFGKADERWALTFGNQKFNLHEAAKELEPKAKKPIPGSADLCLVSRTPIDDVIEHLRIKNIKIEQGLWLGQVP
jgi:catechol 2,3-dioxygenase-like lactoylglutathione lyase family enzyme